MSIPINARSCAPEIPAPASTSENSAHAADVPAWHAGYLRLLPALRSQLRFAFGRLPPEAREEAIQEGLASTLVAYRRLFEQGRAAVARPSPLANYAIRQFRAGRITGGRLNADGVLDINDGNFNFGAGQLSRSNPGVITISGSLSTSACVTGVKSALVVTVTVPL